jgi:hypothetical protein
MMVAFVTLNTPVLLAVPMTVINAPMIGTLPDTMRKTRVPVVAAALLLWT